MKQITATGRVNDAGRLSMYMGELNYFFDHNKGKRIVATFSAEESKPHEYERYYYYSKVVADVRKALWEMGDRKTKEQTDYWLRRNSPICIEEKPTPSGYVTRVREIEELSEEELLQHIDTIAQFAAEELHISIL